MKDDTKSTIGSENMKKFSWKGEEWYEVPREWRENQDNNFKAIPSIVDVIFPSEHPYGVRFYNRKGKNIKWDKVLYWKPSQLPELVLTLMRDYGLSSHDAKNIIALVKQSS